MTFKSSSAAKTKTFAIKLARELLKTEASKLTRLQRPVSRGGQATILTLTGDLGSGKTTFAQGFLKGLGVREKTASPTFIIMRRFVIPRSKPLATRHSP